MKFTRKLKNEWEKLLLGDFTPHTIAFGLAIGSMVALLPTFGFSILLALLLIFIFPNINRPAIFVSLIIWNPLFQIPIYALSFHFGSVLFADATLIKYDIEILNQLYTFTRRFLVAHLIIVFSITITTYIMAFLTLSYKNSKLVQ